MAARQLHAAAPTTEAPAFTGIAPRREGVRTYLRYGRETYADTGRPVEENLGTHVVLWIVDDADAWAAKIEADGDAAVARHPRCRIAKQHQARACESAADVRARGPHVSWYGCYHSAGDAARAVTELQRAHPNPGVRYEAHAIVEASACPGCHQPTLRAAGQVRHALGGYPADCPRRPEPAEQEPRLDGEWEIGEDGYLVCGYCDQTERWPELFAACATLTGFHTLGIARGSGELVVLAEARTLTGQTFHLAHPCEKIPDNFRDQYTAEIAAAAREEPPDIPAIPDGLRGPR
ncbi:hypothetical protein [Nonomuraea endophytica]|uniref:hypothetical protein n=1 Tax=Nonomuraea endophytica TaxID=714136 RepID=UPI0037CB1AE5